MELRQGPLGVHLRHPGRPHHHAAGPRRRRQAAARVVVGGPRRWRRAGLAAAAGRAGVLVGGRRTVEDAYAYSKFARMVLGTNDIDFRSRAAQRRGGASSWPPHVAGQPMTVTYADLEKAPAVLLAGFEPEEESPIVFLRLRKAARKHGLQVLAVAPFATRGLTKMSRQADRAPRPAARPRRSTAWPTTTLLNQPGVDHPGRRAAGDLARSPLRGKQTGRRRPVPGWAGFRGGRATAARWRPVRCRTCCPADDRSPTRRRASRPRPRGTSPTCPTRRAATPPASSPPRPTVELGALLIGGVELADLPDPTRRWPPSRPRRSS